MRDTITASVQHITHDRLAMGVFAGLIVLCFVAALYFGATVKPSDIQVYTHYTSFGGVNFYTTQWYYAASYALFFVMIAALHLAVGVKLYNTKGRVAAIGFGWFSIGVVVFAAIMLNRIAGIAFSF